MSLDLGRKSIAEWAESAPDKAGAEFVPAKEKFLVDTRIGKGGMGEVFLVTDQDLRRQVAMKVLRRDVSVGREQRLHFIAEAQATSQLEHPGIPPIHDIGLTPDGRLYFTMKLVRGRTLREVLHDLVLKRREVQSDYSLHRLVTILERIAEALHFAHERGVVHRDLKPENIMLGDYGEVHLMDWGLARVQEESGEHERVRTARTSAGLETEHGAIKGTLPYMSPEQARGEEVDGRTDVYALGSVLYEVLALRPAFDPDDREILSRVVSGEFPDVASRDPGRPVPDALASICRKAMSKGPLDRHATAREMGDALRAWLDGRAERERRHEEAEKLAAQGKEGAARFLILQHAVGEAEGAAGEEARKYQPWQPLSEKLPLLDAKQEVERLRTEAALAFAEATHLLNAALTQESDNDTAREALARLWRTRLEEAETRGDKAEAAQALAMISRHADGRLKLFVESWGALSLASDPPGAEVLLYRYVEEGGLLVASEERPLGETPLDSVPVPMGSYLCVLRRAGFRDTRYPVHITRNRHWQGRVRLRTDGEIGDGFVYVPAGPFLYGEGKERTVIELGDFAIARYPVTLREYAEFLMALDEKEAAERLPSTPGDGPQLERLADGTYRPLPVIVEGNAREWCLERYGEDFEWGLAVVAVSWDDAVAYCAWKTKTTGKEWRLPTEQVREKAARGVDGRAFPWGDLEDASLAHCRESRPHEAQPEPVGAFPTAVSVYGMGNAAGEVWDWTDSWFDERRSARALRGGSWDLLPATLRCAFRFGNLPRVRSSHAGFRCVRGL